MRFILGLLVWMTISIPSFALGLEDLSNRDAVSGLKDALTQGAAAAIGKLGVENGFLGNDRVKIPLPDALKRIESGLRLLGMQRQADELVTAMNRAAEQAVPEAKALLTGAVKNMSVQDAKGTGLSAGIRRMRLTAILNLNFACLLKPSVASEIYILCCMYMYVL